MTSCDEPVVDSRINTRTITNGLLIKFQSISDHQHQHTETRGRSRRAGQNFKNFGQKFKIFDGGVVCVFVCTVYDGVLSLVFFFSRNWNRNLF